MNSFLLLTLTGLVVFVVIRWGLEKACDNSRTLDLEKERKLTEEQ